MDKRVWRSLAFPLLALLSLGLFSMVELPGPAGLSLRVSAADLFLPFCVVVLALGHGALRMQTRLVPWAVAVLTVALCLSAAVGVRHYPNVTTWILLNKLFGWFVLLAYFYAGAASSRLLTPHGLAALLKILVAGAVAGCAVSIAMWELLNLELIAAVPWPVATPFDEVIGQVWGRYRMSGLLANSNSLAYVLSVVVLLVLPRTVKGGDLASWPVLFGISVLVLCIFYTGSRSAMGALCVGLAALALLRRLPWRQTGRVAAVAVMLGLVMQAVPIAHKALRDDGAVLQAETLAPNLANKKESLTHRTQGYRRALELWMARPLTGTGLGGVLSDQVDRGVAQPQVIHSTWLWLLAEAGPLALAAYALLLAAALRAQWAGARSGDLLAASMVGILLMTGVIGLLHEMLYQRMFWLLLGLALCWAPPRQDAVSFKDPS